MELAFLARGLAVGFTVAAAVGPISLLTIRRTLAHGRRYGLVSGLGVAAADASYGAVAAFGLTAITSVLVGGRVVLGLVGGLVLLWLAVRTFRSDPGSTRGVDPDGGPSAEAPGRPGLVPAFASIYGLTMTNPMTILSFAGIFAGVGLVGRGGLDAALLVLGVFLGSGLWWVVLTGLVGAVGTRLGPRAMTWINRASGAVLVAFGAAAVATSLGLLVGAG